MKESRRGFVKAPSLEQLKPTPEERHLLGVLWDWLEHSKRSKLILGVPLNEQAAKGRAKK